MSVKKYLGETSLASLWAKIKALIPTKTSDLTNDSGYLTSYTETDPTVPSWAKESTKPTYTASEVGAATSTHAHGNITNGGDITTTATIASGDRLVINDESASKVTNSSITFGDSTTTFLANNGTWATPTDTKVTATPLNAANSTRGLLFSSNTGSAETTSTVATSNKLTYNDYQTPALSIYNAGRSKNATLQYDGLYIANASTDYRGKLKTYLDGLTADRTYTFPDKSGTVALTSDIPTVPTNVSAFTNDAGYAIGYAEHEGTMASVGAASPSATMQIANLTVTNIDTGIYDSVAVSNTGVTINSSEYIGINSYGPTEIFGTGGVLISDSSSQNSNGITLYSTYGGVYVYNVVTPTSSDMAANKAYVDNAIPTTVSSFTNDSGYLTLATLPIYNGSYSQVNNS